MPDPNAYYKRARITRAEADRTGDVDLYDLAAADFRRAGCRHAARACAMRADAIYTITQAAQQQAGAVLAEAAA